MLTKELELPKIDKAAFSVTTLTAADGDVVYWRSLTPEERLRHLELLRRINYGHHATERLQRVFEVVERTCS